MTLTEFIDRLIDLDSKLGTNEALVVVRGEHLPPHGIKDIEAERHDDADGSTTIWITVEEM